MGGKQREVRLPEDMWEWIESLPERYGTNNTEKLKAVLYRGKEELEREERWISAGRARESSNNEKGDTDRAI